MTDEAPSPARRPRADAARNRQRLIEAARAAFAADGASASLEDIARDAGVGIGTLYRHFPTRDALIAEVYRAAIGQLADAAGTLARERPPVAALRAWMLLFVDYLATKQIMSAALATMAGGTADLYAASGSRLQAAMEMLAARAVAAGELRLDIGPLDLLRAVAGVANNGPDADWQDAARRMVDILISGLANRDVTAKPD